MKETKTNPTGWILYDDSCGFCRRWIPFWEKTLRKRGFEIAPLQADWVKEKLQLNENDLLLDLRLLLASGEQIQGADTYRHAMKRIWWAYPIYLFSILPLCRRIFDWSYRKFAAHRHQISRAQIVVEISLLLQKRAEQIYRQRQKRRRVVFAGHKI